jgi:uncharacterized protein (DUF1015 family)
MAPFVASSPAQVPWPPVPELLPFPAMRYDASTVGELGAVLCPPYDVIDADERARMAGRPHNAVQLELPEPVAGVDQYERAAALIDEWRSRGVLVLDERPMVYVYEQTYRLPGVSPEEPPRRARGLFCRLRLEEPGQGVMRHERTLSAPKEDRFRLLAATGVNLSPVLLLFQSAQGGAASSQLLDRLVEAQPAVSTDFGGAGQRLWAFDPERSADAQRLLDLASARPLAIADGHHRYETALRYRDEVGGPGSDCVLALLYDADSGGLGVLPTHRLVSGVPETEALLAGLQELFDVEPQPSAEEVLAAITDGGVGVWTRHGGASMKVRPERIGPLLPAGSEALRRLDVTILATALQSVLGLSAAELDEQGRLSYTKDAGEAVARVADGSVDACFLLNATPVASVLDVAMAGELMPPKSTFFVPKAATGLVFNLLSA